MDGVSIYVPMFFGLDFRLLVLRYFVDEMRPQQRDPLHAFGPANSWSFDATLKQYNNFCYLQDRHNELRGRSLQC